MQIKFPSNKNANVYRIQIISAFAMVHIGPGSYIRHKLPLNALFAIFCLKCHAPRQKDSFVRIQSEATIRLVSTEKCTFFLSQKVEQFLSCKVIYFYKILYHSRFSLPKHIQVIVTFIKIFVSVP